MIELRIPMPDLIVITGIGREPEQPRDAFHDQPQIPVSRSALDGHLKSDARLRQLALLVTKLRQLQPVTHRRSRARLRPAFLGCACNFTQTLFPT